MTIETATKLREAAALIEERGHAFGTYENLAGQLCLYGAIARAHSVGAEAEFNPEVQDAALALQAVLPDRCNDPKCGGNAAYDGSLESNQRIFHYNDFHCDGGSGAIEVLIQAAEKLEAEL